jgi:hypothetical protein
MRVDRGFALSDAILAQAKDKPHKAIPLTFAGDLLHHHLRCGAYPGWYDLLGTAGWDDKAIRAGTRRKAEPPEQVATLFVEST